MVRIPIMRAAFEAIARSLPLGNVSFENKTDERGERYVWLDPLMLNRLRAMRGPGESYSDVIIRVVADAYGVSQPTVSRIVAQHRVLST
jgi:hypothetical protein